MSDEPLPSNRPLHVSRLVVPALPELFLARPRLNSLLNLALQRPVTLVSAPAGFGKTTMLSAWARQGAADQPCIAWLSLDAAENEPIRFCRAVFTALAICQPSLIPALLARLDTQPVPPLAEIAVDLINLLAAQPTPTVLVLDNFQVLTSARIHAGLTFLLDHQPPQLRLVIGTRADPPLPFANLRARGRLLEIRANQLHCTPTEAAELLARLTGRRLAPEALQDAVARADGWLAGLRLLALGLLDGGASAATGASQQALLDYFRAQVLRPLSRDLQTFLLHTSIVDQMCAALCNAIRERDDSQTLLDGLVRANLFVDALDSERRWYTYQPLFAEALRALLRQREPLLEPVLHLRASSWYATEGQTEQAAQHALLAQAWEIAADQLDAAIQALGLKRGQSAAMYAALGRLPAAIVRTRPRLCLFYAERCSVAGQLDIADHWLRDAEQAVAALDKTPSGADKLAPHSVERQGLLRQIALYRALIAAYYGQWRLAQALLLPLSGSPPAQEGALAAAQARIDLARGAPMPAVTHLIGLSSAYEASGSTELAVVALTFAAPLLQLQGRIRAVWQITHQAIQLGTDPDAVPIAELGAAFVYQADVLREWNRLDEAAERMAEGLRLLDRSRYAIWMDHLLLAQARLHQARGDIAAAAVALSQLTQHPLLANNPYQQAWMLDDQQVRLWIAQGDLGRADRWAHELVQSEREQSPFARDRQDIARARVALARAEAAGALALLEPLLARAQAAERWGDVIDILLLITLAHDRLAQATQAIAALKQAVRLAEPEGYILRFVEAGAPILALLVKLPIQEDMQNIKPYLARLLAAFPAATPQKRGARSL